MPKKYCQLKRVFPSHHAGEHLCKVVGASCDVNRLDNEPACYSSQVLLSLSRTRIFKAIRKDVQGVEGLHASFETLDPQ